MLSEIRNSSHRNDWNNKEGGFEWWYVDGRSKDLAFNLVVHETDILGLKRRPYLSMSVFRDGHDPVYDKLEISDGAIKREGPYLVVKSERVSVVETEKETRVNARFPSGNEIDLTITKGGKPYVFNNGTLFRNDGGTSCWVVQVPLGGLNGNIDLVGGNKEAIVDGSAYQDHNWGDLPIQRWVKQWVWGRMGDGRSARIFWTILTKDSLNSVVGGNVLIDQSGADEQNCNLGSFLQDVGNAVDPSQLLPKLVLANSADITTTGLMRGRVNEKEGETSLDYLRWSAVAGGVLGVIEYLRIKQC